jgi:hypothetical protein
MFSDSCQGRALPAETLSGESKRSRKRRNLEVLLHDMDDHVPIYGDSARVFRRNSNIKKSLLPEAVVSYRLGQKDAFQKLYATSTEVLQETAYIYSRPKDAAFTSDPYCLP